MRALPFIVTDDTEGLKIELDLACAYLSVGEERELYQFLKKRVLDFKSAPKTLVLKGISR